MLFEARRNLGLVMYTAEEFDATPVRRLFELCVEERHTLGAIPRTTRATTDDPEVSELASNVARARRDLAAAFDALRGTDPAVERTEQLRRLTAARDRAENDERISRNAVEPEDCRRLSRDDRDGEAEREAAQHGARYEIRQPPEPERARNHEKDACEQDGAESQRIAMSLR